MLINRIPDITFQLSLSCKVISCGHTYAVHIVTIEKAAKHIFASKINKWPQSTTFSTFSSCCMNLPIMRTVTQNTEFSESYRAS